MGIREEVEWELVLGGDVWESKDDCMDYIAGMVEGSFNPGDRIAIYRRRGEEWWAEARAGGEVIGYIRVYRERGASVCRCGKGTMPGRLCCVECRPVTPDGLEEALAGGRAQNEMLDGDMWDRGHGQAE